ncbi:MAG: limonene-1,2-epoxide hydrolase [Candidatus Azotimanducaceae bacterium]|jgi:limonene-1,2-epoxide hydrolase
MIDATVATNTSEKLVLELIRSMETGGLANVVQALCTEDFVWANSGLETIYGQEALFAQMSAGGFSSQIPILKPMTHFSAEILHMASRDGVVFTERVDHHWDETGRDLMTPHICGVAEIRDNKISAFRDFYDVGCYSQIPTGKQEGFDLVSFRTAQAQGNA